MSLCLVDFMLMIIIPLHPVIKGMIGMILISLLSCFCISTFRLCCNHLHYNGSVIIKKHQHCGHFLSSILPRYIVMTSPSAWFVIIGVQLYHKTCDVIQYDLHCLYLESPSLVSRLSISISNVCHENLVLGWPDDAS